MKVRDIMNVKPVTVQAEASVSDAARILRENKVSGLPVLRNGDLVGMITESDLFNILLDVFGARQPGIRVTAKQPMQKGGLAKLSGAISAAGGHFMAFAESLDDGTVTFKVAGMDKESLVKVIEPLMTEIEDVRET